MSEVSTTKSAVQEYYGQTLKTSSDLQTDACCTADALPDFAKPIVGKIHDEVLTKYYGCGIVIPENLKGAKILDLGSGSGRDCYVLSALVGESGHVVGVDMTDEQLAVANRHRDYMAQQFGFKESNVTFLKGDIEKLGDLDLAPGTFDCIISNCVVNLAEDKQAVLDQAYRLLKVGGEMYFSDVYADRRVPENLKKDPVLYGECLSGALYWNDFKKMARKAGFLDSRKVESRPLSIDNGTVAGKIGNIQFSSITYRLFKLEGMEEDCEDYGQAVRYKGGMDNHPHFFQLDEGHLFEKGRVYTVCGNTYKMLADTRFAQYFDFWGDFSTHFGLYEDCGTTVAPTATTMTTPNTTEATTGSCC